jgi:hypothetical protein
MSTRPIAVTAACLLAAVAALATTVLLSVPSVWAVPPTAIQRAVGLAAIAATVGALVGLWRMRRWSVVLIAILLGARVGFSLLGRAPWNPAGLAGPVLLLLIGALYWRRMT